MKRLTIEDAENACLGGGVFACGGGGWYEHGLQNGRLAVTLGRPVMVGIDDVPQDGLIITISATGAPASDDFEMWPRDYIRAFELVRDAAQEQTGLRVVGLMNAQNGYSSSVNCWMPAASSGLPVIDAAGDVRAHPTIKLGAMGYAGLPEFQTMQAAVGGKRDQHMDLELLVKGNLFRTSNIMRAASVQAGGFIASARLPLPVSVVKQRAAHGSISAAIRLGEAMRAAQPQGGDAVLAAIVQATGGTWLGRGRVRSMTLRTEGGFDHGAYSIDTPEGEIDLRLMNEFMTAERGGERLATFPDTISVCDAASGLPLKSANITEGREVAVLHVHRNLLPLGAGVLDYAAYPELEQIMGLDFLSYLPEITRPAPQE
ncbi:DUF917 domain-containing protein [Deinococcus ruber]|uniref:DUF917 domain-containing protein n=1 Tax=Deinococcus ruber TaxID=1848197 RepID=A0A918FAV0_9DEIO|nr:DUF917 family protein [Deinococcus ruber]GGR25731.1 hypothetical protein GCM10008957_41720 [Deinococcus ruber]